MSDPVTSAQVKTARWALWLPLVLFGAFVVLVLFGLLRPAEREVRSKMIGKPLPEFSLQPAIADRPGFARADMATGQPRLLNIFASWCVPCAAEAPVLAQLRQAGVEVHGVAIRDQREDLDRFFARYGNPFARVGADHVSAVQFALGSSGVPETFVIDARGTIRYQHIGEVRPEQVPMILEQLKEAEQ